MEGHVCGSDEHFRKRNFVRKKLPPKSIFLNLRLLQPITIATCQINVQLQTIGKECVHVFLTSQAVSGEYKLL
jgi:hypothetical protein